MKDVKGKVLELAKVRGLDIAEETVENLCHLAVDVLKLLSEGNAMATGVMLALEPVARKAIESIDLNKDEK